MEKEVWREKASLLRKRFTGREDTFAITRLIPTQELDEAGQPRVKNVKSNMPMCDNYGNQTLCLITQNRGGCSSCNNRVLSKLTDERAYEHITGKREIAVYQVTRDGIKFGACDFDYFDPLTDAKKVMAVSKEMGLPCYLARSSSKGYHVYWFFSDWVKPHVFLSFVRYMYDKLGFYVRYNTDTGSDRKYLPESFPKQTVFEEGKFGSCINIPMVETRMKDGFKCWLDNETGTPLPIDKQWEYFRNMEEIPPIVLDGKIQEFGVELFDAPTSRTRSVTKADGTAYERTPYTPPESGDFGAIVTRCPALAQYWEKDEFGVYKNQKVPHNVRVASLAFAINTKNGIEIIRQRWASDRTEKEIRYAMETNQKPHTCRAMQDNGVCLVGIHPKKNNATKCFDKKPPKEKIDGQWVINPENVPEHLWADPSPSRLAKDGTERMTAEQIMHELSEYIDESKREADFEEAVLAPLLKSSRYLPKEEQSEINDYIVQHKMMGKRDLGKLGKQVEKELKNEINAQKKASTNTIFFNGVDYFKEDDGYTMSSLDAKGNRRTERLTNFTVELLEEVEEIHSIDDESNPEDRTTNKRIVIGDIIVENQRRQFRCGTDELFRSAESFFDIMTRYGGTSLFYMRKNYDHIRNCAIGFQRERITLKKRVSDIGHHKHKGEYYYLMPSVIVDKNGVHPNKEYEVNLSDEMSRQLDFVILDRDEFKDLCSHILSDYFLCNSKIGAMTAFGHALAASIMPFIPMSKRPILWLYGDSGGGKSFVLETAQCFFGNFRFYRNMDSSEKSKIQAAMDYRHVLLLVDDYKHALQKDANGFYRFLQSVYDGSAATKLNRDGSQRSRAARARGLLCFSGEDIPKQEESNIARMVILEVGKHKNSQKGEAVLNKRRLYSGLTPYFIHYVYNQGQAAVKDIFQKYVEVFEDGIKGIYENSLRIAQNLAYNMTAFHLAMDMFAAEGVIPLTGKGSRKDYIAEHETNLLVARTQITSLIRSQRGSEVFLSGLQEILNDRAHYYIQDYPPHMASDHKNARPVGFWMDKTPDLVYIYPQLAYAEVSSLAKRGTLSNLQSPDYVARQLVADGHIPADKYDKEGNKFTKQVRGPEGRPRVWVIKLESLKLDVPVGMGEQPANTPEPPIPNDNPFH